MASILPPRVRKQAGLLATIAAILFMTVTSVYAAPNTGVAKSLVTVYADNSERIITTTVVTVGEALERAGIELGEHDLVEPGLDTFINSADFRINVYRARPITIVDGATQKTIMSPYQSPRLIAEAAGITVYDEDLFTFELIDDILQTGAIGQKLTIERAVPITLNLYGESIGIRTHSKTVGEVLNELDISLEQSDRINLSMQSKIKPKLTIYITREGTKIITEKVNIPFETETIQDSNRFVGSREVKTPGVLGLRIVTYELQLENGVEVSRREINSVLEKNPEKETVLVGTKPNASIGDNTELLLALRTCETHGNYQANTGNGYYGAYQFLPSTWDRTAVRTGMTEYAGILPSEAPAGVQDLFVLDNARASSGGFWTQHPGCSTKLGLPQFPY